MNNMKDLNQIIQAILFASPYALPEDEIFKVIAKESPEITLPEIEESLQSLVQKFSGEGYGMEIQKSGMGYSFVSKSIYYPYVLNYIESIQRKRLSKSALETLSIIAFQPDCTKVDIEQIRGVSADYAIEKLIERELIEISGRKALPGNPSTYRITSKFMDYFGIDSMEDLPKLEILAQANESVIGEENS
jgi:segregation and condensation protein B